MSFDPRSPTFRADPYPQYDLLRTYAPVYFWPDWQMWFLSRHADCHALLRDERLGHGARGMVVAPPQQQALVDMMDRWMLLLDAPDHTRLRSLVQKAFTPRIVAQLRPQIQATADELLDAIDDTAAFDLVQALAYPLPVAVICLLLGVPKADFARFHDWSDAIARSLDLTEEEAVYNRASVAAVELTAYLEDLVAERRRQPGEDLLSNLVAVEEQGERLTIAELYATCALLLIAGHETTVNLIGNGTLALLRNPDQWRRLREEPELSQSAVEELLRYDSPVQLTTRLALADVALDGQTIRAGQQVSFLFGAANRDPAQFVNPAQLDLARRENRHLSLGGGVHYCLGAPLARLEGEIAFQTLARRLPALELASDSITYRDNLVLRGLTALPVAGRIVR